MSHFKKNKLRSHFPDCLYIFSLLIILLFTSELSFSQRDSSTIIYVGDRGYPPYEFIDKNGKASGLNVDLIYEIGKVLNKRVIVKLMNWTEARKEIENGNADVHSMFYLPERSLNVDFGDAFTIINHQIFIRKDSPSINNLEDISGKELILQNQAYVHDMLQTMQHNTKLVLVEDEPSALKLLASGKHDCSILGEQVGRYAVHALKLKNVTTSGPPLLPCEYRLAVRKGNTQLLVNLNNALSKVKLDGSFDRIYNKWLLVDDDPGAWEFISRYLQYLLALLLLITLIILFITVHYKNRLQKSSVELKQELEIRTKIEYELRSSQQMLAKAQKIAQLGNWELDLKTNTLTWSEQIFEIFGIPRDTISAHYDDLFKAIHPEDRQKRILAQADAISNKKPMDVEYRIIRPDGSVRHILTKGEFSFDENNNAVRIFGTAQDITERKILEEALKDSEERYKLLFKNNPLPMWVYNTTNLKFLAVNYAAEVKYGYTREEFLNMTIEDIRPYQDIAALKKFLKEHGNEFNYAGVWRHKKKDGTIINTEIISHSINFGDVPARLILANDVTEKLKAEEELQNSKDQLRELAANLQNIREEERTAVAREIHDELGQVLTYLKINLTLLGKSLTSNNEEALKDDYQSEIKGMTDIIDKAVKRIRKLITELRPEVLDNLGLIPAFEWLLQEFTEKTGIKCKIEKNIDEVQTDKQIEIALFRIFQEALTNIVKHAQASEVQVKFNRIDSKLILEIADNGTGMDLSKSGDKKTFGLIGIRERAIILGGNFNILSEMGSGTKLSIEIPLKENS